VVLKLFNRLLVTVPLQLSRCLAVHYQTEGKEHQKRIFRHRFVGCSKYSSMEYCACLTSISSCQWIVSVWLNCTCLAYSASAPQWRNYEGFNQG